MLRGVEDLRLLGFLGFRSPLASGSLKERCIWPRVSRKERGKREEFVWKKPLKPPNVGPPSRIKATNS